MNLSVQRMTSRLIFIHASQAANRQAINHRIMETLPAQSPPCMQNFQVAKGSHAPARVEAGNRRTIHAHVVHARPLSRPGPARRGEASECARACGSSFSSPQLLQQDGDSSTF